MTMSHKFKQDKFLGTCRYCNKPETEHMKNLPEKFVGGCGMKAADLVREEKGKGQNDDEPV